MKRLLATILVAATAALLGGCHYHSHQRAQRSSSLMEFLYPENEQQLVAQQTPVLSLPLRVGIAFTPSPNRAGAAMSSGQREALLERVASRFRALPFVSSIELIPDGYLRAKGGFANLDQLRRMMGVEVIVLLSYDQMQFSDENLLSLTYWTIVGTYLFHGNRNDTQTLVEASVFDIASRSFLFRAPGSDQVRRGSTGHEISVNLRQDSEESMRRAIDDLGGKLATQLDDFKLRIKEGKAGVRIEHRPGYTGAGALDGLTLGGLAAVAGLALIGGRRRSDS